MNNVHRKSWTLSADSMCRVYPPASGSKGEGGRRKEREREEKFEKGTATRSTWDLISYSYKKNQRGKERKEKSIPISGDWSGNSRSIHTQDITLKKSKRIEKNQ